MTTAKSRAAQSQITFPDPDRMPDDMTTFEHLAATGNAYHLLQHLIQQGSDRATTLLTGEHFLSPAPTKITKGLRIPDLLVAFDVDPAAFKQTNAYVISQQGKPPDFVLEVASASTGRRDVGEKRDYYERIGVAEFWRFDETGRFHGARLGGDRLVDGRYQPVELEELASGDLQGYCAVLNLYLRWEDGQLGWYDPATNRHIPTFEAERAARIESDTALMESDTALQMERAALQVERAARLEAEARRVELEAENRRLREAADSA